VDAEVDQESGTLQGWMSLGRTAGTVACCIVAGNVAKYFGYKWGILASAMFVIIPLPANWYIVEEWTDEKAYRDKVEAAALLEARGISAAVINPRWIKPLDTGTLEFFARSADVVCTFEDHVIQNGYGSSVIEHLSEEGISVPVVRIGWPDQFVEHGAVDVLRKKHGVSAEAAVERVLALLDLQAKPALSAALPVVLG